MSEIWRVHSVCDVCGTRINVTFTPDEVRAAIIAHVATCPTRGFSLKMIPFEPTNPPTVVTPKVETP